MFFQLYLSNKSLNSTATLPLTDLSLSVFTLWQNHCFFLTAVCSSIIPPCFVFYWVWVCVLGIRERERPGLKWVKRITKIARTHMQTNTCRTTFTCIRSHVLTHFSNWLFPWAVAAKLQPSSNTGTMVQWADCPICGPTISSAIIQERDRKNKSLWHH